MTLTHELSPFRYASLYFCCAIEQNDNELLTLEIIHRYVELLDKYFGSVSAERHSELSIMSIAAINECFSLVRTSTLCRSANWT